MPSLKGNSFEFLKSTVGVGEISTSQKFPPPPLLRTFNSAKSDGILETSRNSKVLREKLKRRSANRNSQVPSPFLERSQILQFPNLQVPLTLGPLFKYLSRAAISREETEQFDARSNFD